MLGAIVLLLVAAQVFLPGIAARVVRKRVARYGLVQSVSVKAFPAIKLLWEKADSATVSATHLRLTATQAADLLWSARNVHDMDLKVGTLTADLSGEGPLTVRHVTLHKRGAQLQAQAQLSQAALQAAAPGGIEIKPLSSGGGQVEVQASGQLFGVGASVRALVGPEEGKLVVQPQGLPFAGFARLTLFADPRVDVQGVGLSTLPAGPGVAPGEYQVRVQARLG